MALMNAGGMSDGLARVRVRFVDELRLRRIKLVELRAKLDYFSPCPGALKEVGQISHKIAGAAATLGFPRLGASAAAIDDAIDQKATSLTAPDPALLGQIDRLISDMELAHQNANCT